MKTVLVKNVASKMDIKILCEKFCNYLVFIRGLSKSSARRHKFTTDSLCKFANVTTVDQVTEEVIRNLFFFGRSNRKWKVTTFLVYRNSLIVFFRWCVKEGYIEKNPVECIEIPKSEKRLPSSVKKQDALRLLDVVNNYPYGDKFLRYRNHAIFSTFIFAGLRLQELTSLKYTDVDVDGLTIFIRKGKGNRDRIVPMSFTLALSLKKYLEERKRLHVTCPEFFASYDRTKGFTENGCKNLVKQLRKASGIQFTAHKLRHTFATLKIEGGCDIYSLSRMMGHSDITTTTIYLSASAEHLRSQMLKHPLNDMDFF